MSTTHITTTATSFNSNTIPVNKTYIHNHKLKSLSICSSFISSCNNINNKHDTVHLHYHNNNNNIRKIFSLQAQKQFNKQFIITDVSTTSKQCSLQCRSNTLHVFPKLKYLNNSTLHNITTSTLDVGFLKESRNVNVLYDITKDVHKQQEMKARKTNRKSTRFFPFKNKTNVNTNVNVNAKSESKFNEIANKKLFLANVNKSKQLQMNKCLSSLKRSSMLDRFLLKLMDPNEIIEDYIGDDGKNRQMYQMMKLKRQCVKAKWKVEKLLNDVKKTAVINNSKLKVYVTRLKCGKSV